MSFYKKPIPEYKPDKLTHVSLGKTTMILLIELYLEWLPVTYPLDTREFLVIHKVCPNSTELNKYPKAPEDGCQLNGAVVNIPGKIYNLEDIVSHEFHFSYFVDGVVTGKINTDDLPKFSRHMAEHYEAMELEYRLLEAQHLENPNVALPQYQPPQKPKSKVSTKKEKSVPGYTFYEKMLKHAFMFKGSDDEGDSEEEGDFKGDYDNRDLTRTFHELLEQKAIKSVQFHQQVLKRHFVGKSTPKAGIGKSITQAVENFLEEKKMSNKESAKEKREGKKRQLESPSRSVVQGEETSQGSPRKSPRIESKRAKSETTKEAELSDDGADTGNDDDSNNDDINDDESNE